MLRAIYLSKTPLSSFCATSLKVTQVRFIQSSPTILNGYSHTKSTLSYSYVPKFSTSFISQTNFAKPLVAQKHKEKGIGGKTNLRGKLWKSWQYVKKKPLLLIAIGAGGVYLFSGAVFTAVKWTAILGVGGLSCLYAYNKLIDFLYRHQVNEFIKLCNEHRPKIQEITEQVMEPFHKKNAVLTIDDTIKIRSESAITVVYLLNEPPGATVVGYLDQDLEVGAFVITKIEFQAIGVDPNGGFVKQKVPIYERAKKDEVIEAEIIDQ